MMGATGEMSKQRVGEGMESPSEPGSSELSPASSRIRATRLEQALDWAAGLAPSPMRLETSCCGMAMASGGDFFEALGTGPPAVSSRSADLLIVAGSLTRRQVPLVREIYGRMLAPRWVIAWGACAISGGAYDNYATISGLSRILPVDVIVPGCPPAAEALRDALGLLRSGATRSASREETVGPSSESEDWPIQDHELFPE
jgi:NADH-quinone oxidoreductase subunit B